MRNMIVPDALKGTRGSAGDGFMRCSYGCWRLRLNEEMI